MSSFQPLHRDKEYKFKCGHWTWGPGESKLKFHPHVDDKGASIQNQAAGPAATYKQFINVAEEQIFREIFARPKESFDSAVITLQDVKNLALFTRIPKFTQSFLRIVHTDKFDEFLHSTIFYIDFFLLVLELLLIRRDETADGRVRDTFSIKVEQFLSKQLTDRRVLMARDYSKILLNSNEENATSNKIQTRPSAQKDLHFFESLIDFTIQCTFIAMHRRAFNAISTCQTPIFSPFHNSLLSPPPSRRSIEACELNRLFRTEFFNIARNSNCLLKLNFREQQILFGASWFKNSLRNFRRQMSPLTAELLLSPETKDDVLRIGKEKYFGSNEYLFRLELEFTTPECHLSLIGCRRGLLGHPKHLYDTMLNLSDQEVRRMNFSQDYDPYGLVKRAFIRINTKEDFSDRRKNLSTRLIVVRGASGGSERRSLELWRRKELIMNRNLKMSVMD